MCVQKFWSLHTRPHTCSHHPFLYTCVYTGLVFLHWPDLFTLPACIHSCSPLFMVPTPVHTCPYLSYLTIIRALHRRSHLPLAPRPCPYILTLLFLCSGPGQRELGCSEAEGAPDRGLCPALTVLPAAQGAAHGVGAGASRGGCVTGGVCGGIWIMATPCFRDV